MAIDIGIIAHDIDNVVKHLNNILSDEYVLYTKTLNYHWNIVGPDFDALHLFLRKQYEELFEIVDVVAERIRALDRWPLASLQEFLQHTRLQEDYVTQRKDAMQMLHQLLKDHETVIKHLRKDIMLIQDEYHDIGTANLLTDDLLEVHEKIAWMLRSFVQK